MNSTWNTALNRSSDQLLNKIIEQELWPCIAIGRRAIHNAKIELQFKKKASEYMELH